MRCYRYQAQTPNISKRKSTGMKLEAELRQAKLMADGDGHWVRGQPDVVDLSGKKLTEKRDPTGQEGKRISKGSLLSAYARARLR